MQRFWKQGQKHTARVALDHGGFVGDIRRHVGGMHTEHVPLGLKGTPQLAGTLIQPAGNDDCLDARVRKRFFHVANCLGFDAPAT